MTLPSRYFLPFPLLPEDFLREVMQVQETRVDRQAVIGGLHLVHRGPCYHASGIGAIDRKTNWWFCRVVRPAVLPVHQATGWEGEADWSMGPISVLALP